jgi:1-hydroxycarotenoid 3,4-desaturase
MTARERTASPTVVVAGGGIGGLVAALELAHHGARVRLCERGAALGGKIQTTTINGRAVDVGPTVLTMRWVFDQIFADVGAELDPRVRLVPAEHLARHAWDDGTSLDLFADRARSEEAIARFASAADARGFGEFCRYAARIYHAAEKTFMLLPEPSLRQMARAAGPVGLSHFLALDGLRSMHRALGRFFRDPRLVQLFGRYATYYGSSPYAAPATLNLIAHVEGGGVWLPADGMSALASAIAALAEARGATLSTGTEVVRLRSHDGRVSGVELASGEQLEADAVIFNGDVAALAAGALGPEARTAVSAPTPAGRSLSALTVALVARVDGLALAPHTVFFWRGDYAREFSAIFRDGVLPRDPTVYIRAQDRDPGKTRDPDGERLFFVINAPPRGDSRPLTDAEVDACLTQAFTLLERCGLRVTRSPERMMVSTPTDFHRRFPHSGGALYGGATHSFWAPLRRSGATTRLPGLYLASGSGHPGAGVPMAALAGRHAAARVLADVGLTSLSPPTGMPGGTSMR